MTFALKYSRRCPNILNLKQHGNGTPKKTNLDAARRLRGIYSTSIRMIRNLTSSSSTRQEHWKRIWIPLCPVKRNKTLNSRHCRIPCQPAGEDSVPKHSWRRPHAPKKRKNQGQFMLTKLTFTKAEDAASMITTNTSTKSILQTEGYKSMSLYTLSSADTYSESNANTRSEGGS